MWIKNPNPDSAQVRFPPPVAVLLTIGLGFLLNLLWPLPVFADPFRWYLGGAFLVLGLLLVVLCIVLFRRAHTPLPPWEPTESLITYGPYRLSRNPIYLGMIIFASGAAVLINGLMAFVTVGLLWGFLNFYVVPREEAYLRAKLGASYERFHSQVRRWL